MKEFNLDKEVNHSLLVEQIQDIGFKELTIHEGKLIVHGSLNNSQKQQIQDLIDNHDHTQKSQKDIIREKEKQRQQQALQNVKNASTIQEKVDVLWDLLSPDLNQER